MKKLFSFIIVVILVLGVYGYVFKKKLPGGLAEKAMAGVYDSKFMEENNALSLDDLEYSLTYTELSYDNGYKEVSNKTYVDFKKTGDSSDIRIQFNRDVQIGLEENIKIDCYAKDGKYYENVNNGGENEITKEAFNLSLGLVLTMYSPIDISTGKLLVNDLLKDFEKVEQIHFEATGYATSDDTELQITYNFQKKKIVGLEYSVNTLDGDGYLVKTQRYEYKFK